MSNTIQKLHAKQNLEMISTYIFHYIKQTHNIELDANFKEVMFKHMKNICDMHGRKQNNMSDDAHLDNLNKMVIDACIKEVLSNKQKYQPTNTTNNFSNFGSLKDSNRPTDQDPAKLVEQLAQERGYNLPKEKTNTPALDFTLPTDPKGINTNQFMQKMAEEKKISNGMNSSSGMNNTSGMNLNELLGTSAPIPQQRGAPIKAPVYSPQISQSADDQMSENNQLDLLATYPKSNISVLIQDPEVNNANISNTYNTNGNITNVDISNISIDLRVDLLEKTDNQAYIFRLPENNKSIVTIELVSCIIGSNQSLLNEPYIFIGIQEVPGSYQSKKQSLFGKLFIKKTLSNFIVYQPENCISSFIDTPMILNNITISFHHYNGNSINMENMIIKKIIKHTNRNELEITTKNAHYMGTDDEINIYIKNINGIKIYTCPIISTLSDTIFIIKDIGEHLDNRIEIQKKTVKCSLTFKIGRI
jgi:hypothetical protein